MHLWPMLGGGGGFQKKGGYVGKRITPPSFTLKQMSSRTQLSGAPLTAIGQVCMETGVTETRTVGGGAERSNRRMARVTQLDSQECRANDYHVVRNGNYDKTLAAQEEVASFYEGKSFSMSPEIVRIWSKVIYLYRPPSRFGLHFLCQAISTQHPARLTALTSSPPRCDEVVVKGRLHAPLR